MKTPKFWNKKGIISTLLLPLGWLYAYMTNRRMRVVKGTKVSCPVICVGNLTAGGTGKTPVCMSIAKILKKENLNPFFVSRGYGGKLKGILVNNKIHTPKDVGDEPLLLSKEAPIVVSPNRFEAAKIAIDIGANIIIMDDGFQNPYLKKDLSFVVVDGTIGFGNRRPIPSGPLRENLKKGLKRANAIIIIGDDKKHISKNMKILPIFHGSITTSTPSLNGANVLAFAGIGRPEKFFDTLRSLNANLIQTIEFPDHYDYKEDDIEKIINKAKELKSAIYTTSKDYVKIPAKMQDKFNVIEIEIKWEDEEALKNFILENINSQTIKN